MELSPIKKLRGVFCCAYACKNPPYPKKGGLCNKHYSRKRRVIDPIATRFGQMKGKAKQRGIDFSFNLSDFRAWCARTGYLKKGVRGFAATVDRRCNVHGYHLWNMQIMSNRANASKGNRFQGDNFNGPNYCPF
jgi:hypothetical protein